MIHESRSKGIGIKEINYGGLDTLLRAAMEEDHNQTNTMRSAPVKPMTATDRLNTDEMKKSPQDTFNIEIINSRDWGKPINTGPTGGLPVLPIHKGYFASKPKSSGTFKPREREKTILHTKSSADILINSLRT